MARPVISADDVRAAQRRGERRIVVPRDAIVTPMARDEAARWGIELGQETVRDEGRASTPRRHAATCDPDDLERVVERVRRQVPDADPAIVREVARQVLERLGDS